MSGRTPGKTLDILISFYQGPYGGQTRWVKRDGMFRRWGRLCLKAWDAKLRQWVIYKQAKPLPGAGVPERWAVVNERGRWISDEERRIDTVGEYKPNDDTQLPWEDHGAEYAP